MQHCVVILFAFIHIAWRFDFVQATHWDNRMCRKCLIEWENRYTVSYLPYLQYEKKKFLHSFLSLSRSLSKATIGSGGTLLSVQTFVYLVYLRCEQNVVFHSFFYLFRPYSEVTLALEVPYWKSKALCIWLYLQYKKQNFFP